MSRRGSGLLRGSGLRGGGGGLGRAAGLLEAVRPAELLAEPLHAAGGIHELLLAREERVATRADIHVQLRLRAAGHEFVAASTADVTGDILRVNFGFHDDSSHPNVRGPKG